MCAGASWGRRRTSCATRWSRRGARCGRLWTSTGRRSGRGILRWRLRGGSHPARCSGDTSGQSHCSSRSKKGAIRFRDWVQLVVDAGACRNVMAFANDGRSKERSNAAFLRVFLDGVPRMVVVATRAIAPGAEVLLDYAEHRRFHVRGARSGSRRRWTGPSGGAQGCSIRGGEQQAGRAKGAGRCAVSRGR